MEDRPGVVVYTDGSLKGHIGGWAVVGIDADSQEVISGWEPGMISSTQVEFFAILMAVMWVQDNAHVTVFTDSKIVYGMLSLGWRGQSPSLIHLVGVINDVVFTRGLHLRVQRTQGHSGTQWNEEAHRLAKSAVNEGYYTLFGRI